MQISQFSAQSGERAGVPDPGADLHGALRDVLLRRLPLGRDRLQLQLLELQLGHHQLHAAEGLPRRPRRRGYA